MKVGILDLGAGIGMQNELLKGGNDLFIYLHGKPDPGVVGKGSKTHFRWFKNVTDLKSKLAEDNLDLLVKTDHLFNGATVPGKTIGSIASVRKLEMDRQFGADFIQSIVGKGKLRIPKTVNTVEEAKRLRGPRVVAKLDNNKNVQALGSERTFILFKRDLDAFDKVAPKAMYQQYIEGTEVGSGGYMSKGKFIRPFTFIQEYKRKYPKSMGNQILTGESGSCGIFTSDLDEPFQSMMDAHEGKVGDYYGFLDLNCMIDAKGDVYFLEYTSRMGFPTEYEVMAMLDQPYASFLSGILQGKDYTVKNPAFASLKVVDIYSGYFPYQIEVPKLPPGLSIVAVNALKNKKYWSPGIQCFEDLFVVTADASTVRKATKALYDYMPSIQGLGIFYLTEDVGSDWTWRK